ncbi:hypothetical protein CEXT_36961 [Caerostris extrusa]|uniref:Uncharacterized protein n=1 Tax=Caerostris extrusa TaxID=172846 RepID=A0AAV4ULV6_CAEEX|nr:hypothetical protein CEXT_36961 [Caerostris extrusa]
MFNDTTQHTSRQAIKQRREERAQLFANCIKPKLGLSQSVTKWVCKHSTAGICHFTASSCFNFAASAHLCHLPQLALGHFGELLEGDRTLNLALSNSLAFPAVGLQD